MGVSAFFKKNLVLIVMVPMIIGGHYGWYKLQEDDRLVSPKEREQLTIFKMLKNINLSSKD